MASATRMARHDLLHYCGIVDNNALTMTKYKSFNYIGNPQTLMFISNYLCCKTRETSPLS